MSIKSIECPSCHEKNNPAFTKCWKCGKPLKELLNSMSWQNSFKRNESELSKKIFQSSLLCAEPLKKDLEVKFKGDSKEVNSKYIRVLFEFMYFFLHLTIRSAFTQLGQEKRDKLQDELAPLAINTTIETLFGHWPENLKDGIKNDFYENLNNAETEYSTCKVLLLDPKDDTSIFEKIGSGERSKAMINMLVDNIAEIITGKVNIDFSFPMTIIDAVLDILKKKEIERLVLATSQEIK